MANAPPKKGVIRRLTERWRKGTAEKPVQLSNYPAEKCSEQPEKVQIDVSVRWTGKKKPRNRPKKQSATLEDGQLELRDRSKTKTVGLACGFTVDLAKVIVACDDRRVILKFPTGSSAYVTPSDQQFVERFKDMINRHRLYRQEVLQAQTKSGVKSASVTSVSSLITTSDDFRGWDVDPTVIKVLDAVREMQSLSLAVLEKSNKCLEELKAISEELRGICGDKEAKRSICATATRPPTATVKTPEAAAKTTETEPKGETTQIEEEEKEDEETEKEEDSEGLDEEMERELLTPLPAKPEVLLSMEKAKEEAEEKSKRDVMDRCKKILDIPKATKPTTVKMKPYSPMLSTKKQIVIKKKEELKAVEKKAPDVKKPKKRRELLPAPQVPGEGIGFKVLYQLLVNKSGMPMSNYEPIGIVQAACEELVWSRLLDEAARSSGPEERMSLVTAFATGSYLTKAGRYRKPFNPILGETFDYEEAGWKYHGEQVSHHPAICAGYAESPLWSFFITFHLETNVGKLARNIELTVEEPVRVRLKLDGGGTEDYVWQKVKTKIENLTSVPEQRKISHEGTLMVRSTNGFTGRVFFKKYRNPTEIAGDVLSPNDRLCYRLSGYWDKNFVRIRTTGERETLLNGDNLRRFPDYFGFTIFTMGLNEMDSRLPTSDSRNRMDMRLVEQGDIPGAMKHKKLLEELQRSKNRPGGPAYKSLWFDPVRDETTKKMIYYPNNKYWEAKASGFAGVKGIVDVRTDG